MSKAWWSEYHPSRVAGGSADMNGKVSFGYDDQPLLAALYNAKIAAISGPGQPACRRLCKGEARFFRGFSALGVWLLRRARAIFAAFRSFLPSR